MSQANRVYGKHLTVVSVASQALVVLSSDMIVQECSVEYNPQMVDTTCLVDASVANMANHEDYTIRIKCAYDTDYAAKIAVIEAAVGTSVLYGLTAVSGGRSWSGTGILARSSHTIPDGGQTIDYEIIPDGTAMNR